MSELEIITVQEKFDRCQRCRWNSFLVEGQQVTFYSKEARDTVCENCTGKNFQKLRKDDRQKFEAVIRAKVSKAKSSTLLSVGHRKEVTHG